MNQEFFKLPKSLKEVIWNALMVEYDKRKAASCSNS